MQGQGNVGSNYTLFEDEVIRRMKQSPYNCTDACSAPEYQIVTLFVCSSLKLKFRLQLMLVNFMILFISMEWQWTKC